MIIKQAPQLIEEVSIKIKVPIKIKSAKNQKRQRLSLKPFISIIILMLIISLNWLGLFAVGRTIAYYHDIEISKDNFFNASLLDFTVEDQGGFRTQTQGGYGAKAHGNNVGTYRDANFSGAFPSGVLIGNASGYSALFTSAETVENFLPAKGKPGQFTQNYTDPDSTSAGVFAGQTLALALNIGFDNYDPDFGVNPAPLAGWEVSGGPAVCNGMTVQRVFDEANNVLAGFSSLFSASEANSCADYINNKFDGDKFDGGLSGQKDVKVSEVLSGINWEYQVRSEKTGGSDDFCNALNLNAFIDNTEIYSGSLIGFISGPHIFSPADNKWTFEVELPASAPLISAGEVCEYKFIYEGWQDNFSIFPFGFHDVEEVNNKVSKPESADDSNNQTTPEAAAPEAVVEVTPVEATSEVATETPSETISDEILTDNSVNQTEPPVATEEPVSENIENAAETNVSLPEEVIVNAEILTEGENPL